MEYRTREMPSAYENISEKRVFEYILSYNEWPLISELMQIPDDKLYNCEHNSFFPAAWIFGNVAASESRIINQAFILNINKTELLMACENEEPNVNDFKVLSKIKPSKEMLVSEFRDVRLRTLKCIDMIQDEPDDNAPKRIISKDQKPIRLKDVYAGQCKSCEEHLKKGNEDKVPQHDPCYADPYRELFTQLIQAQNIALGRLHAERTYIQGIRVFHVSWQD